MDRKGEGLGVVERDGKEDELGVIKENMKEEELGVVETDIEEDEVGVVESDTKEKEPSDLETNTKKEFSIVKSDPKEVEPSVLESDIKEDESSDFQTEPKPDKLSILDLDEKEDELPVAERHTKEDEPSVVERDMKEDEIGAFGTDTKRDELGVVERVPEEGRPSVLETHTKEVGLSSLETDAKEDELSALEINIKEADLSVVERDQNVGELSILEKDTKDSEPSALETNTKKDKPSAAERDLKEDRTIVLETYTKEDELSSLETDRKEDELSALELNIKDDDLSVVKRDQKEDELSVSERDTKDNEPTSLEKSTIEDESIASEAGIKEDELGVLKRDLKEDELSDFERDRTESNLGVDTKEDDVIVNKMDMKEDTEAEEDHPSSSHEVLQQFSEEAVRVAGEELQSVCSSSASLPPGGPGHRRCRSEIGTLGHKRGGSFQKLRTQVQKAWRWGSNSREEGGPPSFNPEVLANQKRQWYQLHSKTMDHTKYKEPTSLFEHFIIVGLHPEANLEAVEEAFAKRKKWEMQMARSEMIDFKMLQHRGPSLPMLEPQILFKYPPGKKLAVRSKDLAAFCFPGGVKAWLLERTPSLSDLNELVYGQEHLGKDDSSFIFSLKVSSTFFISSNYWASACAFGYCLYKLVNALASTTFYNVCYMCSMYVWFLVLSVFLHHAIFLILHFQVLPGRMLEFLDAPVPFIVGIQNKPADLKIKSSSVVQVNVLKDQVKMYYLPALPRYKELISQLRPIHARLSCESSTAKRHPVYRCNEVQAEAAMQFLDAMRHYLESICSDLRSHTITSVQSNNDRVSLLLKDSFIDSFPIRDRAFIKLFVDTQLFTVLSDSRLSSFENEPF
ncbi:uncharacterized protein LOC110811521 [Carica papaya]|uniref:uncharacterized protein LOC110811521 n=1 Tax=Carica papaya TaxID=3649 RepID=UPI000B8C9B45|nr:uncharacterized protein LOC110811521 [Carica papaya]